MSFSGVTGMTVRCSSLLECGGHAVEHGICDSAHSEYDLWKTPSDNPTVTRERVETHGAERGAGFGTGPPSRREGGRRLSFDARRGPPTPRGVR